MKSIKLLAHTLCKVLLLSMHTPNKKYLNLHYRSYDITGVIAPYGEVNLRNMILINKQSVSNRVKGRQTPTQTKTADYKPETHQVNEQELKQKDCHTAHLHCIDE